MRFETWPLEKWRVGHRTLLFEVVIALLAIATGRAALVVQARAEIVFLNDANLFDMNDQTFNQWLYNTGQGTIDPDAEMAITIEALDRDCNLTDEQRKKLQLAARGDFARFAYRADELRSKFVGKKFPQEQIGQIHAAIQPLAATYQAGLLGEKSLFSKVVRHALTEVQQEQIQRANDERRRSRYGAKVRLFVAMCERSCPLTHTQRTALVDLLIAETPPPKRFGQYDWYYVQYQTSRIANEKYEAILDEAQLRVFRQQAQQGAGFHHFLKQQGFLDDEQNREKP